MKSNDSHNISLFVRTSTPSYQKRQTLCNSFFFTSYSVIFSFVKHFPSHCKHFSQNMTTQHLKEKKEENKERDSTKA